MRRETVGNMRRKPFDKTREMKWNETKWNDSFIRTKESQQAAQPEDRMDSNEMFIGMQR
jgi:hypothetical protein